jgi:hypothetical protein
LTHWWSHWWVCSDLVPDGVICLQYADDTILFVDDDLEKSKQHEMGNVFILKKYQA